MGYQCIELACANMPQTWFRYQAVESRNPAQNITGVFRVTLKRSETPPRDYGATAALSAAQRSCMSVQPPTGADFHDVERFLSAALLLLL
jgi:hypothetical protein